MGRVTTLLLAMLLSTVAQAAEYMEKTPFQLSRAFSPGVITSGGITVWVAGQTATQDSQGNNIANNFEAQVKQVFAQVDGALLPLQRLSHNTESRGAIMDVGSI
jgi:hypothetical protein